MSNRFGCVLLMGDCSDLADAAETFARARFDVQHASRHSRDERQFPQAATAAVARGKVDVLFNYLAPMYVPPSVLRGVRREAINFHPAPPAWPGIGSASYALYRGDKTFGATAHRMTNKIDAGEIVRVVRFPVHPDDTCATLSNRGRRATLELFFDVCQEIEVAGHAVPSGDCWERAALTRAEFDQWMTLSRTDPPDEIARKVRALRHPKFPGPFFEIDGVRVEVPRSFDFSESPNTLSSLRPPNRDTESTRGEHE